MQRVPRSNRRLAWFALTGVLVSALLAAACSGNTKASTSTTSTSPTTQPAAALVKTGQAGSLGKVLTDASGRTLYYFTADSAGASTCNTGCDTIWPPLTTKQSSVPAVAGVSGKFTLVSRSDGSKQVAYNGHPLYTYSGDVAPGEAKGQGLYGKWFAATPGLAEGAGAPASATPAATPTSSSGYSYSSSGY